MARRELAVVREHVRDRLAAILDAVEEVLHVARRRPALVELGDLARRATPCRPPSASSTGFAGDPAAVDEDACPCRPRTRCRCPGRAGRGSSSRWRTSGRCGTAWPCCSRWAASPCRRRRPPDRSRRGCWGTRPGLRSRSGPVASLPSPHWAMSTWCAPQSVSLPPEYSSHQRKVPWQRSLVYGTIGALAEPAVPVELRRRFGGRERPAAAAPPPIEQVALSVLPSRPLRAMAIGQSGTGRSLRCWVPTWKTRFVSFTTWQICLPSSMVKRQRLLAVHVLAGLHRLDGDLRVPVVGRADGDDVDVLAIEHLAVVGVDLALVRRISAANCSAWSRSTSAQADHVASPPAS